MGSNSETHQIDNFETMYLTFVEANNYWPTRIIVTDHQEVLQNLILMVWEKKSVEQWLITLLSD